MLTYRLRNQYDEDADDADDELCLLDDQPEKAQKPYIQQGSLTHCTENEVFQETADLVTFAEEIFNGKLHFLTDMP